MTESKHWFQTAQHEKLTITKFAAVRDSTAEFSYTTHDQQIINRLMSGIQKLSPVGDEYISFSDEAELIRLVFHTGEQQDVVEIYNGMFKTPSTSFCTKEKAEQHELVSEINNVLTSST